MWTHAALPARASTAEHAAAMLRSADRPGPARPGTRLREEQVSAAFTISRNTVREAFRLLSHERLVDHTLHRGVHVRTVSPDDVRSMYLTRRLVEPLGLDAAVGDPAVLGELRRLVDDAVDAAAREDWEVLGTADIEFHRVLMSACSSPHLSTMFEQLLAELRLAFLDAAGPPRAARAVRRPQRPAGRPPGGRRPRDGPHRADGLPHRGGATAARRAVLASGSRHRCRLPAPVAPEAPAPGGPGPQDGRVAVPDAGGRPPGRRWAWRSVGLLLTFLLVLYLGGPLLAGAQGAGSCCPSSSRRGWWSPSRWRRPRSRRTPG